MLKKIVGTLLLFTRLHAAAQTPASLTLEEAWSLARENYPLTQQQGLIDQTAALSIDNLSKGLLPQLSLTTQATYQSAVTRVNIPLPGIAIPSPGKDQYKAVADLSQVIFDGGVINSRKELQQLNAGVEKEKIEVQLHKVRERVNQLYLGILLLDAQLRQVDLAEEDIRMGISKTEALVNNGVTFRSNLDVLKAQYLLAGQKRIELRAARKGMLNALSLFIGPRLDENVSLKTPTPSDVSETAIVRPELSLYHGQANYIGRQKKLLLARNLPKASLFGQGGYGRPGLNQLDSNFDWFYIAGIRLNWSLGGLYTYRKERQLIDINRKSVLLQQETFLLNTNAQLTQQRAEIEKLQQLVASDQQIIDIRQKITRAANAQLENQVITANDYLREINAEDQARQSLILHKILLLQAEIGLRMIGGV